MQCVLFDLDGTLVDSEHLGMQAIIDLLPQVKSWQQHDSLALEFTRRYRGRELAAVLKDLEARLEISLADDFVVQYRARIKLLFNERLEAFPGADAMLSAITLPKCIASGGPLEKINRSLGLTQLAHHFGEHLYSSYELDSWKPEPDLFLHAAEKMGFKPHECVVVEDSEVGLQAAQAAGMKAFHFAPSGESDHELSFSNLAQLPQLLVSA